MNFWSCIQYLANWSDETKYITYGVPQRQILHIVHIDQRKSAVKVTWSQTLLDLIFQMQVSLKKF